MLWSNCSDANLPEPAHGGWRVGAGRGSDATSMVGISFSPSCSAKLSRIEIVVARESGTDPLVAYVMSDSGAGTQSSPPHAPANVLDVLYFFPTGTAARSSAESTFHPTLLAGAAYWVVLTTPAADRDTFFWYRWAQQPSSPIAYRRLGENSWKASYAFGAMLRVEGETFVAGSETAQAPPPAPPIEPELPAGVYRVGSGITPPRPISTPDPEYTESARADKVQGTVVLWVILDGHGNVNRAGVARSLRPDLDDAALNAVRAWRFQPATKDGQPVPVLIHVEVHFRLG